MKEIIAMFNKMAFIEREGKVQVGKSLKRGRLER